MVVALNNEARFQNEIEMLSIKLKKKHILCLAQQYIKYNITNQ